MIADVRSTTLDLALDLIRRPSVTPNDAGCQSLMAERLAALGFTIEPMRFGDVDNLWARRGGDGPLALERGPAASPLHQALRSTIS